MLVKRLTKRGIEEYDDPNCITKEESDARITQEKDAKDAKDAHQKELVKHLQKVAEGKETLDHAKLAQAVLLAMGYEPESQSSEFAKNKI